MRFPHLSPPPAPNEPTPELPLAVTLRLGGVLWITLALASLVAGTAWIASGLGAEMERLIVAAILLVLAGGAWGLGSVFGTVFWPSLRQAMAAAKRLSLQEAAASGIRDRVRLLLLGFVALVVVIVDVVIWGIAGAPAGGLVTAAYFLLVWGAFMHVLAGDLRRYERSHARAMYILPEHSLLDVFAPRFGYVALMVGEEDRGKPDGHPGHRG